MGVGTRAWKGGIAGRRTSCAKDPGLGTNLVNHQSAGSPHLSMVLLLIDDVPMGEYASV